MNQKSPMSEFEI